MRKAGIKKRLTEEFPEFIEQVILQRDALVQSKSAHIKTRESLKMLLRDQEKEKNRRYRSIHFRVIEIGQFPRKWRAKAATPTQNLYALMDRRTKKEAMEDLKAMRRTFKALIGLS